ncbi:twin-arginine translocation signal domain-containing protein [Bilophila wadsworthia]|uniref:twin-arginine translocation signal domain-containing protein n=1 Tax=Bilophila wadsworthia TaxID=35833 RepID=UPI003AB348B5
MHRRDFLKFQAAAALSIGAAALGLNDASFEKTAKAAGLELEPGQHQGRTAESNEGKMGIPPVFFGITYPNRERERENNSVPSIIKSTAMPPFFHQPLLASANLFAVKAPQNTPPARHSPLISQPEGMCRTAARGISRPVSMRKPAQSIRLP